MGLLDEGLKNVFGAAFGSIYLSGTLHVRTATHEADGDVSYSESDIAIKGQVDDATESMRKEPGYTGTDVALIVLKKDVATAPTTDHEITLGGVRRGIGSVKSDPANTHWIIRGVSIV